MWHLQYFSHHGRGSVSRRGGLPVGNMTSYAETCETFTIDIPERFNFIRDVMNQRSEETPDKVALIGIASDGTTINRYTFAELTDMSNRMAHLLRASNVSKGDKVFVQVPRVVEFYAALLGCFQVGAVPMPATTQLMGKDQQYRIHRSDAVAVVCDAAGAERFETVRGDCPSVTTALITEGEREGWTNLGAALAAQPDSPAEIEDTLATDPLLLYFTSGTTGGPKMVQHTGSYALGHEITARFWHDLTPDDVHWTVSDTGWAKAAWGKLSAGEPLNPEVIETWTAATGTTPYDGYGQTETVCLVANYPSEPVKPGSMGLPAPGMHVDVVDDDGNVCADDVEGNICVRTEPRPIGLFDGYWRDEDKTAQVFQHGWYYTGDRATRDSDGYLWFVGRADDVILSAAYRIGPFEVESSLIEHPAVMETAVVGKPDADRGNIVKAFIILAAGYEPSDALTAEIQEHVKTTTAPYKYPREIEYVTDLPKTVSGKIRRVELRERDA